MYSSLRFSTLKRKNPLWINEKKLTLFGKEVDNICDYIKNDTSGFRYANSVKNLQLFKRYYARTLHSTDVKCYNGLKEFYINSNGDGIMCDGELNFIADNMGNIRQTPLRIVWKSKKAKEMRQKIKNCEHQCVQECYLRQDSNSIKEVIKTFLQNDKKTSLKHGLFL